jgi:hypothetical protein
MLKHFLHFLRPPAKAEGDIRRPITIELAEWK